MLSGVLFRTDDGISAIPLLDFDFNEMSEQNDYAKQNNRYIRHRSRLNSLEQINHWRDVVKNERQCNCNAKTYILGRCEKLLIDVSRKVTILQYKNHLHSLQGVSLNNEQIECLIV